MNIERDPELRKKMMTQGCELFFSEKIDILAYLYAETRPPIIWTGKTCCRRVELWVDG